MMLSEIVRFLKYDQPFFVPGAKLISLHAEGRPTGTESQIPITKSSLKKIMIFTDGIFI